MRSIRFSLQRYFLEFAKIDMILLMRILFSKHIKTGKKQLEREKQITTPKLSLKT